MREQHLHHERLFLEEDVPKVPMKGSLPNWGKNAPKECSFSSSKGTRVPCGRFRRRKGLQSKSMNWVKPVKEPPSRFILNHPSRSDRSITDRTRCKGFSGSVGNGDHLPCPSRRTTWSLTVDLIISWKGLGSAQASDFVHRPPPISFGSLHHPPHRGKQTQLDHAPLEGWKDGCSSGPC